MRSSIAPLVIIISLGPLLAACSGSGKTTTNDDRADLQYYIDNINLYEDFDETDYIDPPPVTGQDIDHDVPPELMAGSASNGARSLQTVDGFRIQIHSSLDKEGAVASEEKVKEWWRNVPADGRPVGLAGSSLPVFLKYVQPYYRVRVGNFATREEAEVALQMMLERFPRAFIVVDRVTVLR